MEPEVRRGEHGPSPNKQSIGRRSPERFVSQFAPKACICWQERGSSAFREQAAQVHDVSLANQEAQHFVEIHLLSLFEVAILIDLEIDNILGLSSRQVVIS